MVVLSLVANLAFNNISVISVTAHGCAGGLKKVDLRPGSKRGDIKNENVKKV